MRLALFSDDSLIALLASRSEMAMTVLFRLLFYRLCRGQGPAALSLQRPLPEALIEEHGPRIGGQVSGRGLEEKHLIHIFETFHEGWDCQERLQATLKHYRKWK